MIVEKRREHMRFETDNMEKDGFVAGQYGEAYMNKAKKRKKSKLRTFLLVLLYLAIVVLVLSIAIILKDLINDKLEENAQNMAIQAGAEIVPENRILTLTQEELDAMIEEAVAQASFQGQETVVTPQVPVEQLTKEAKDEVLNGIKEGLSNGDATMVEVLRPFYPDDMVVVSNGKFHFVPINYDLQLNNYDDVNLNILESGEYQYVIDDQVVTHKGIDVSRFQGKINWQAVAADGVEFAFIRVGNRGYGTGKLVEDSTFDANIKGALEAGIHVGVYIYSQAINEDEIREEYQFVMDKLEPYGVKCPIVFDVEKTADASGRMNLISVEERTALTKLFCQLVEESGYKPIIYHNVEMGALMINVAELEDYDKWLAYYNDDMYYPYAYQIWQYSDRGRVSGIEGNVDLNICFEPFWE